MAVVARAFLVAVVVELGSGCLSNLGGCRARAVVARAILVAVVVGSGLWLLKLPWWQWL